MTLILISLSLIALLWLTLFLSPAHKVFFRDTLDAATLLPERAEWPAVTVIVPARNEAAMLPRTVPTICRQDYPNLRVIVVDDQSDDATGQILDHLKSQHPNLETLRAADRPPGWVGKTWAVTQGVEHATAPAPLSPSHGTPGEGRGEGLLQNSRGNASPIPPSS